MYIVFNGNVSKVTNLKNTSRQPLVVSKIVMIKTLFRSLPTRHLSSMLSNNLVMDEIAISIFYAAVKAVTPHELITKNKMLSFHKEGDREIIKIKNQQSHCELDVTDKHIHLGKYFSSTVLWSGSFCYHHNINDNNNEAKTSMFSEVYLVKFQLIFFPVGFGKGVLAVAVEFESVLGSRLTSGMAHVQFYFNFNLIKFN